MRARETVDGRLAGSGGERADEGVQHEGGCRAAWGGYGDRWRAWEYIDPNAGKVRFEVVAQRWLKSPVVDLASAIRYESSLRLHVASVFGRRQLRSIKPSEIAAWIADLGTRFGSSTARTAFLVLHGTLELAVDDEAIKRKTGQGPGRESSGREGREDRRVER